MRYLRRPTLTDWQLGTARASIGDDTEPLKIRGGIDSTRNLAAGQWFCHSRGKGRTGNWQTPLVI